MRKLVADRASYGGNSLAELARRLNRGRAGKEIGAYLLEKVRRLAQTWKKKDARAADRAKIPWGLVEKLMVLDRVAQTLSEGRDRSRLIRKRKLLVRRYRRGVLSSAQVRMEIQTLVRGVHGKRPRGQQLKRLQAAHRLLERRIAQDADLLKQLRLLSPPAQRVLVIKARRELLAADKLLSRARSAGTE